MTIIVSPVTKVAGFNASQRSLYRGIYRLQAKKGLARMARVFVGNLPEDVRERDLSDKFDRFGRIASVRIKFPARPPPFAFIVRFC